MGRIRDSYANPRRRLERDSNPDLCDTGAVICQLSYQAIWEMVIMWVHMEPVEDMESDMTKVSKWKPYIFERGENHVKHLASRASFFRFPYWGGEKGALPELRQLFEAAAVGTSGLVNLVFSRQTGFSSASIRLVIKLMVIIEPAVPWKTKMATKSGILGLGSRLYPGSMQRILDKDLTRFMQSLPRERQNRASKRKAQLAGCTLRCWSWQLLINFN